MREMKEIRDQRSAVWEGRQYPISNIQYSIFKGREDRGAGRFPRYGKLFHDFSTLWKIFFHGVEKNGRFFHAMEDFLAKVPRYGRFVSTVWKTSGLALLVGAATLAAAEPVPPAHLALALDAEGEPVAAAIEFRRLALGAEEDVAAARWYWWAAQEYVQAGDAEMSNRMLDRAEDAAPLALATGVSWLRAENALRERDWSAAAFHFDSLRLKAEADDWRDFSARGAASAHLREKNVSSAREVLDKVPGAAEDARGALERYAAGRNKKPWLGGMLGLMPGLGYVYSGEYANATRSLILNSLFIWGMVEAADRDAWGIFAVVAFGEITWYTGSIYGGVDAAHRHNARRLESAVSDVRGPARPEADRGQVPLVVLRLEF